MQRKIFEMLNIEEIKNIANTYDYIPEDAKLPYIVIGEDRSIDYNTKTAKGKEITTTIHIWCDKRGSLQTKKLLGLIEKALVKDFQIENYIYEYKTTEFMSVERETIELLHGTIQIIYRAWEVQNG
ncbi:DUF3168 domain-containing protein [Alkalithermobacter thermoalcaliphilus]|uniref:DUF3168 domain-containing protein n=1 Tax=Clostridium paradoxum TaxID=29346 RepID=UPI002F916ED5